MTRGEVNDVAEWRRHKEVSYIIADATFQVGTLQQFHQSLSDT